MANDAFINWTRRILSTVIMMTVFFVAFIGGFSLFLSGNFARAFFALFYIILGLIVSKKLWI